MSDVYEPLTLSPEAIRVLGVLLEKEKTTPDNYPLSLNALTNGCNQSTNRNPVVAYDEMTIERALTELREHSLAVRGVYAGSRVPKHRHSLEDVFDLSQDAQAVLTILLLRGEQTLGEIKQRTDRMAQFASLDDCDKAVDELVSFIPSLAIRHERIPGQKEGRISHTLSRPGEEVVPSEDDNVSRPAFQLIEGERTDDEEYFDEYSDGDPDMEERVDRLEKEITVLTHEIMSLRAEIDDMRDPSA